MLIFEMRNARELNCCKGAAYVPVRADIHLNNGKFASILAWQCNKCGAGFASTITMCIAKNSILEREDHNV